MNTKKRLPFLTPFNNRKFKKSTAKSYISNSYQGNLNSHRHRIFYTLIIGAILPNLKLLPSNGKHLWLQLCLCCSPTKSCYLYHVTYP